MEFPLLFALVLLAIAVVLAAVEPRRLLPGLLLTLALLTGVMWLAGLLLMEIMRGWGLEQGAWIVLWLLAGGVTLIMMLGLFLLFNAWTMARKERLSPAAMASGGLGALLLAYIGLSIYAVVANSFDLVIWLMYIGLPAGYFAWVFVSFVLYGTLYGWLMRIFARPVEAVVVLGSWLAAGERVTPLLAARLNLGKRVYERSRAAGRQTIMVPSGGQGDDEQLSEAAAMARFLRDEGVPGDHIRLEDRSTDTQENLAFSKEVLVADGVRGRVAVTTNNYHAFRAALLMRKAGMRGYCLGARTARYYWPSATVREFLAVVRDHFVLNVIIGGLLSVPLLLFALSHIS